jgi:hypothetical protein
VQGFMASLPASSLMHAICRDAATENPVFEIKFSQDLP